MTNVMIVEDDPMAQKLLEIFVSGNGSYVRLAEELKDVNEWDKK